MGYLQQYNDQKGVSKPTATGSGYLKQYNSLPPQEKKKLSTPKPIITRQPKNIVIGDKPNLIQQAQSFISPIANKITSNPVVQKKAKDIYSKIVEEGRKIIKQKTGSTPEQIQKGAEETGKLLQKTPNLDLGTKGKKLFKATDTETAAINFISNFPSAIAQSFGQSLELVSTDKGRKRIKNDAINLPKTMEQVKTHVEKKEWQQAFEVAMSNTALTVGLDVAGFIPTGLITKWVSGGVKSSLGLRKTAQTLVKEAIEETAQQEVKAVGKFGFTEKVSGKDLGFEEVVDKTPNPSVEAKSTKPVVSGEPKTKKPIETYIQEPKTPQEVQNIKYIKENPNKVVKDYETRVTQEYGTPHVITADEGKYVLPGYEGRKAPDFHESASGLAKYIYDQKLVERKGQGNNTVMFTAGGTGSGKTTALRKAGTDFKEYSIIYDTNLTGESAVGKIQQALDNGYKVEIKYIQRDPIVAFEEGVIPRVRSRNRIVTIDEHIARHKAINNVVALKEKFGDKIDVEFIDNTGLPKTQKAVSFENLPKFEYNDNELRKILNEKLTKAINEGKITKEEGLAIGRTQEPTLRTSSEQKPTKQKPREVIKEETITKESTKKPGYTSKNAKVIQQTFSEELSRLSRTAKNQDELITGSTKIIDDGLEKLKGDRTGLAGLRTAMNKEMFDLAGVSSGGSYKQKYAEFKAMLDDPSIGKYLQTMEEKIANIDELIKTTPEKTKVITKTVEKVKTEKPIQQPIGKGKPKVSRLAAGVEAKAVENKLVDNLGSLPEYKQVNMKDQSRRAIDLLAKDTQKAIDIALGKRTPPADILPESVFVAVENKAIAENNVELLRQLATSVRSTEATAMGQRIRALAERNPDSAVGAMKEIVDERVKAVEKRVGKSVNNAIKEETAKIKAKVKTPDKYDWGKFLSSIQC